MMTETTIVDLRDLVMNATAGERRAELLGAVDDLQRAIAGQALAIRNLTAELRNRRIGQAAMEAIVPAGTMEVLATRLGEARRTAFSMAEAQLACAALVEKAARAGDVVEIAGAVARVVRVFV